MSLGASVNIAEVFPPKDHVQRLYCSACEKSLDLAYVDFHEEVSGIDITIEGLPVLRCPACGRDHLPDRSRLAIIELHRKADEKNEPAVRVTRRKLQEEYLFTKVPFLYDSDDYRYLPGLERSFDIGFLTPVFFRRNVLLKCDFAPGYRVKFASMTYGEIVPDEGQGISFGINRNGKVMMWLGDIARLPESEQYYLRSENVESDHSIGSEFYDGQIECIYTKPTEENRLYALRSEFIETCFKRFGEKIAHLDEEVLDIALSFNAPVVDTPKERRHVADTLNKIYIESLDNAALGTLLKKAGCDPKSLGSLKRLQAFLETLTNDADVPAILSPFFVLYDLRVAYSHLQSDDRATEVLKTITDRLGIARASGLLEIYSCLTKAMAASYEKLGMIMSQEAAGTNEADDPAAPATRT
jgi:YgiT-type zinc finger domain-containing protein